MGHGRQGDASWLGALGGFDGALTTHTAMLGGRAGDAAVE